MKKGKFILLIVLITVLVLVVEYAVDMYYFAKGVEEDLKNEKNIVKRDSVNPNMLIINIDSLKVDS
jgi:flagellar basal body-associated protein FliL